MPQAESFARISSSSLIVSAANFLMPSESFSTAIWSSLCSYRKVASSRCTFSIVMLLAEEWRGKEEEGVGGEGGEGGGGGEGWEGVDGGRSRGRQ